MTDTIEQAGELLCERVYPETAAHHNERVAQCLVRLVDELKEIKANNIQIWDDARELQAALTESNRQRDELRGACKELATWDADDFLVWYDTDHSDFLADWNRFKQALKETSPPENTTHD